MQAVLKSFVLAIVSLLLLVLMDLLSRAIIKCWFWAIEIVGSFLFIVSFLFLSFHYNFSFDRKVL